MSQSHPPTTTIIIFMLTLAFWQLLLLDAYPAATVGRGRWELILPNIGSTAIAHATTPKWQGHNIWWHWFWPIQSVTTKWKMETRPQGASSQGGLAQFTLLNTMWLRTPLGLFLFRLIFGVLQAQWCQMDNLFKHEGLTMEKWVFVFSSHIQHVTRRR